MTVTDGHLLFGGKHMSLEVEGYCPSKGKAHTSEPTYDGLSESRERRDICIGLFWRYKVRIRSGSRACLPEPSLKVTG